MILKIILKYSLYRSNIDVFCLLTALAIILDCPLPVGQPGIATINVFFFLI